jgi:DNA replication protein DnaC
MEFVETKNNKLDLDKIKMNCDGCLSEELVEPLSSFRSGFNLLIAGYSGSGKTSLLVNLLSKPKKQGIRQSFKNLFSNIVVVSPSLHTLKNNVFKDLADEKQYKEFNEEMLDNFYELLDKIKAEEIAEAEEQEREPEPQYTLLILDDVASSLRKNKKLEQRFINLLQNRRHLGYGGVSVISIVQSVVQVAPQHRNNLSHLITFKPKNKKEEERIYTEFVNQPNKFMDDFFNYFFQDKYDFMLIDLTLRDNPDFVFYRKYNKVDFNKKE